MEATQKVHDPFVAKSLLKGSSVIDDLFFSNNRTAVISEVTKVTEGEMGVLDSGS